MDIQSKYVTFLTCFVLLSTIGLSAIDDYSYKSRINVTNEDSFTFDAIPIEFNLTTPYVEQDGIDVAVYCGEDQLSDYSVRKYSATEYGIRTKIRIAGSSFNDSCYAYYGSTASLVNLSADWLESAWNVYYNFTDMETANLSSIGYPAANWTVSAATNLAGQNAMKPSSSIAYFVLKDVEFNLHDQIKVHGYNTTPTTGCSFGGTPRSSCVGVSLFRTSNTSKDSSFWMMFPINSGTKIFWTGGLFGASTAVINDWQSWRVEGYYSSGLGVNVATGSKQTLNGSVVDSYSAGVIDYALFGLDSSNKYVALPANLGAEYHAVMLKQYSSSLSIELGAEESISPGSALTGYASLFDIEDFQDMGVDLGGGILNTLVKLAPIVIIAGFLISLSLWAKKYHPALYKWLNTL